MNPMRHQRNNNALRKGQSMLEAVIASGIIITAVSSALTLVQSSISAEKDSESSIVGGNLAREAVEVVRNIRDSNWLAEQPFDTGLEGAGFDYVGVPIFDPSTASWTIDFTVNGIDDGLAQVYRYTSGVGNATVGLFVQAASKPENTVNSPFRRIVTIDALCDDGASGYTVETNGTGCGANAKIGVRVTVLVRWAVSDRPRSETVVADLFDWR